MPDPGEIRPGWRLEHGLSALVHNPSSFIGSVSALPIWKGDNMSARLTGHTWRLAVAVGVVALLAMGATAAMQSGNAAGRPSCLVSNEQTGVGLQSLAEAITAASARDTLVVKGACEGTHIVIDKDLRLKGVSNPAFGIATVASTDFSEVFVVLGDVSVVMTGLRIDGGYGAFGGAGIYIDSGMLTLNQTTVTGGAAAVGGGIYNFTGTVVLNNSRITGNIATAGGGIFNGFGSITLNHSTVSGNSARDWEFGSGINQGGGVFTLGGTITLKDSTISGNSADDQGGGIYNLDGASTLINCLRGVNVIGNTPDEIYP
jgi:hypothetical protein